MVGLDEQHRAIWGDGRGTTKLSFAADTRLNSAMYNLGKKQPPPGGGDAGGGGGGGVGGGVQLAGALGAVEAAAEQVFELEFAGEGPLGLNVAHAGKWADLRRLV